MAEIVLGFAPFPGQGGYEVFVGLGRFAPHTASVAVFKNLAPRSAGVTWLTIESTPYGELNGEAWVTLGRFARGQTPQGR